MRCFNDVVNIWPNIWRGRRSRGRADVRSAERAGQDWIRNMIFCPSENLAGRGLIRGRIMSRSRGAQSAPAACNARTRILRASPGFVRRLGRYIICGIIIAPSIFEPGMRGSCPGYARVRRANLNSLKYWNNVCGLVKKSIDFIYSVTLNWLMSLIVIKRKKY